MDKSDHEELNKEGENVDVPESAAIQKSVDSSTLSLHNSFDLLHEDGELPLGEEKLDPNHISADDLFESAEIVDKVSEEPKVADTVKNDSFEPAILDTNMTVVESDTRIMFIPTSAPQSPEQCSQAGRRLYPSAAIVSAIFIGDPNLSKQAASSKIATYDATIITLITTYDENIGPDKGRISQPSNSKNTSEACKKSEKLLSKFWADGLDSDHAFEEGKIMSDEQEQNLERDIEEGSFFTPFMSRRQKKKNKKKHANKLNDTRVQNTFSEHIQTRSKKGVIKSNPKYL